MGSELGSRISCRYYEEVVNRERASDSDYRAQRIVLKLSKLRRPAPGDAILDIGCGTGVVPAAFRKLGLDPTGIEIVPEFVDVARRTHPDVNYVVGVAEQLPFPDGSFDFVTLSEVLEHVQDWRQTLREAGRVLRRGGVLYLSTTNRLWPIQAEIRHLHGFGYLPSVLQRRIYALAAKHRPEMIGYTHLPALHWFTWRQLSRELRRIELDPHNWLSLIEEQDIPEPYRRRRRLIMALLRSRFGLYAVLPQGTNIVARKTV